MTTPARIAKGAATRNARGAAELGLTVEQYCGLSYMRRSKLRKFDDPKQAGIEKGWLDLEGNPLPPKPLKRRPKGAVKAAEKLPRFMNQIKAHNFRKVASEGCYVYAYLRPRSSDHGKAGSPYYVGKATSAGRPFEVETHSVPVPKNRRMVRVLASGLTNQEALDFEIRFISHYGRIDIGSGRKILRNMTPGGDDGPGFSDETRQKRIDSQKEATAEERAVDLDEYLALSEKDRAAFLKWQGRNPGKSIADWQAVAPSRETAADHLSEARSRIAAAAHGVPFDCWQQLTDAQREAFGKWHRDNPNKTLDDWLASPRKRGVTSPEALRRAAERSAQTMGIDVEDWLTLTKSAQNAFRVWWLRNKGSIAEWKAKRRGPNKKPESN